MKNIPTKIYFYWTDSDPKYEDWDEIPLEKGKWGTKRETAWDIEYILSPQKRMDFDFKSFLNWFNDVTGKRIRTISDKTKRQINARLREGYTKKDIVIAIKNCMSDPFHQEHRHYLTPEFITRSDKLEKYLNYNPISLPSDWYNRDLTESQKKLLTEQQLNQWINNKSAVEMAGKRLKPVKI